MPEQETQSRPARILVVEDEVLVRLLVADELRSAGFTVIEAVDGREAWSYLSAGGIADLVFSDIQLPGPLDGLALAERLAAAYPSLPVMLTSGNPPARYLPRLAVFVPKPYDVGELVSIISGMFVPKPPEDGP